MSKTEVEMGKRIIKKIENAGADSKRNAVSIAGADLDLQEQFWFPYLVGTRNCNIKKTDDSRYYRKTV
jgi:hypothetical protein